MAKRILLLCIALVILHQRSLASDLVLTLELDKLAYSLDDIAFLTGTLKNVSQSDIWVYGNVEYSFSVFRGGVEVWRWSILKCG